MKKKKPKLIEFDDGPKLEVPEELESSLTAARQALSNPHLRFKHDFIGGDLISILSGNEEVPALLENRTHPVLPLDDFHWLGLQLRFRTALSHAEIRSVSLIVLRGDRALAPKVPVLRAEWQRAGDEESRAHAQPHWHVYSALVAATRSPLMEAESQPWILKDAPEDSTLSLDGIERFHLAMAAQWHGGDGGSHYCDPTATGIGNWLRGCISYTRQQLAYVRRKAKTEATR